MKKRIRAYSHAYFVWYYDEMLRHIIKTTPRVQCFESIKLINPKTNMVKFIQAS